MPSSSNESIVVRCDGCKNKLKAPAAAAGRRVKCPNCGVAVAVPGGASSAKSAAMPSRPPMKPTGESIRAACPGCGIKVKVASSAAGKRVPCPKCKSAIPIPTPAPAVAPVNSDWGLGEEGDGLLDELAAAEKTSATLVQPNLNALAPIPGLSTSASARASTEGGFSVRDVAGAAGGAVVGLGKFFGPLALGCLLACVGALIGGALWTVAAMFTEREFGLLAWGVGVLVGLGMTIGLRRESLLGGAIAAVLSFASIIGAKYAIFVLVLTSVLTAAAGKESTSITPLQKKAEEQARQREIAYKRHDLAAEMVDPILDEWGDHTQAERNREFESAWDEAHLRLEKVSDEEILRRWNELQAKQEAEERAALTRSADPPSRETLADQTAAPAAAMMTEGAGEEAEGADMTGEEVTEEEMTEQDATRAIGVAFGHVMFGLKDLLLIPLALATAFRIGYRGVGDS